MRYTAEEFQKKLNRWAKKMPEKVKRALELGGWIIKTDVQKNRLTHQVLHPQSGNLRASIDFRTKINVGEVRLSIGTNQKSKSGFPYGWYWEVGARKPRPFLKPAIQSKKKQVMDLIATGMMEAYKKA